jgi:hypothetical protein
LFVASPGLEKEVTTQEDEVKKKVPYIIARGDGSTGGGGLPMPKKKKSSSSSSDESTGDSDIDDDGLRRPKVSAEMPLG